MKRISVLYTNYPPGKSMRFANSTQYLDSEFFAKNPVEKPVISMEEQRKKIREIFKFGSDDDSFNRNIDNEDTPKSF